MAIDKDTQPNIDNSNLAAYPNGQIKDDSGSNDGTAVARVTMSDQFEFFAKLMRLANLTYNNSFDNEVNGYQYVKAAIALAGKNDYSYSLTTSAGVLQITTDISILNNGEILFAKAAQNYTTETQISDNLSHVKSISISTVDYFKTDDYLLLINNGSGLTIIRLATADNFNALNVENGYINSSAINALLTAYQPSSIGDVTMYLPLNSGQNTAFLTKFGVTGIGIAAPYIGRRLLNGQDGYPDMTGRGPIGTTGTSGVYPYNTAGGSDTVTLAANNIPPLATDTTFAGSSGGASLVPFTSTGSSPSSIGVNAGSPTNPVNIKNKYLPMYFIYRYA